MALLWSDRPAARAVIHCAGCDRPIHPNQRSRRAQGDPVHDRPRCVEAALADDGT